MIGNKENKTDPKAPEIVLFGLNFVKVYPPMRFPIKYPPESEKKQISNIHVKKNIDSKWSPLKYNVEIIEINKNIIPSINIKKLFLLFIKYHSKEEIIPTKIKKSKKIYLLIKIQIINIGNNINEVKILLFNSPLII